MTNPSPVEKCPSENTITPFTFQVTIISERARRQDAVDGFLSSENTTTDLDERIL